MIKSQRLETKQVNPVQTGTNKKPQPESGLERSRVAWWVLFEGPKLITICNEIFLNILCISFPS